MRVKTEQLDRQTGVGVRLYLRLFSWDVEALKYAHMHPLTWPNLMRDCGCACKMALPVDAHIQYAASSDYARGHDQTMALQEACNQCVATTSNVP